MCYRIILESGLHPVYSHGHCHPIPSSTLFVYMLDYHLATKHPIHTPSQACQDQFILIERGIYQSELGKWICLISKQIIKIGFFSRWFTNKERNGLMMEGGTVHTALIRFTERHLNETRRSPMPEQEGKPPGSKQSVTYMLQSSQQTRHPATHKMVDNVDASKGKYAQLGRTILTYTDDGGRMYLRWPQGRSPRHTMS
jgi:hypothetical protein